MQEVTQILKDHRDKHSIYFFTAITLLVVTVLWVLAKSHNPEEPWGAWSLLPTTLVLVAAIYSKRPFESLLAGTIAGLVMIDPGNLITPFADTLSSVFGSETIVWVILVCGFMGGLIVLLELSGCMNCFSGWLQGRIKNERQSLMTTYFIGVAVFIDDYLNCLAVSSSVKKLTDHYKVSREKLAYIIDSTAAPMCIIVPVSTWAVFFAGLLEENNLAAQGEGLKLYISAIPYMIYGWVAMGLTFLVAIGVVGNIGPMKKAEARAKAGQPIPDDFMTQEMEIQNRISNDVNPTQGMINFAMPMLVLVGATIYYDIDLLKGVMAALAFTVVLYYIQGLLNFSEQVQAIFDGFKLMLYPLSTVIAGFMLKEVNDSIGMTSFVIETIAPFMSREMMPAIIFLSISAIVFGTASSWGVYIIAIPIVMPIAIGVDASIPLMIGALLSSSSFGSHACFFSDSTVLAAQGAGCSPMSHAFTQFPYALIGAVVTFVIFLILGVVI